MATKPSVKSLANNSVAILNAVRNDSSLEFQNRVPAATQESIKEYGNAVLSYTATMNEFIDTLVNRIGKVIIFQSIKIIEKGYVRLRRIH